MNADDMKSLIAEGAWNDLEAAWTKAVEENLPAAELAGVLEAVVAAGQTEIAEVLAWALLADHAENRPAAEAIETARRMLTILPDSGELRQIACSLFAKAFGDRPHFAALLDASGLSGSQTPRRAFQTLATCLPVAAGGYVANRFDHSVLRVGGFDAATGEFELFAPRGAAHRLDPRTLADEFDPAEASDFRVLFQHRPDELASLCESDPAAVLIGLCQARGGEIDSTELKDALAGRHVPADKWSGWWNRARTAAKRCPQLSLEGRNPVTVVYYPDGRTLEEEMAGEVKAATMPLEKLAVLRAYVRQAKERKLQADAGFVGPIMAALARQAREMASGRPSDALAAALALEAAGKLGLPTPAETAPPPAEILAHAARPARAVADLPDAGLWPAALDALAARDDAATHLEALLHLAPAGQLDAVSERLRAAGGEATLAAAATAALNDPVAHLELFCWLYDGPAKPPTALPGPVDMLTRALAAIQRLDTDIHLETIDRTGYRQRLRSALSARDYANYRRALEQMSEGVAGTFKGRIHRCAGLAQAVREDMMNILREKHYGLFVRARVIPWLDEGALWTTTEALHQREALLKEIIEIKMPENARAIGAAAEHGDLSENSEWKFAIEERDLLRARANKLQNEIAMARVIDPYDVPDDSVAIGSKVALRRVSDNAPLELTVLGVWDTDLERNVFSYKAAIAADLMGKSVGDEVTLKLDGPEQTCRIEAVGPWKEPEHR